MLVSDRLRKLFTPGDVKSPGVRPWFEIKQDNSALLLVSPDGNRFQLIGPKLRYVSDVLPVEMYYSLIKKLGREPNLWPENGPKPRKRNVRISGVT